MAVGKPALVSVAAVSALTVSGLAAWGIGSQVQSPDQAAAQAAEPVASWIAVPVERRVLSSTLVLRGDAVPEVSVEAGAPSSVEGPQVVTALGPATGDPVVDGSLLLTVSGRPVFVLQGSLPVYRTLAPGMSGDDVTQLQQALVRLGYSPDTDGTFGLATMSAVSNWYAASGVEPVWSKVTDQDVQVARRAVDEAEASLAEAQAALTTANGSTSAVVAAQNELGAARRALADAIASKAESVANAQVAVNNAQRALDDAIASKAEAVANSNVAVANATSAHGRSTAARSAAEVTRDAAHAALQAAQQRLDAAIAGGDPALVAAAQAAVNDAAAAHTARTADALTLAGEVERAAAAVISAQTELSSTVRQADNVIASARDQVAVAGGQLDAARRRADAAIASAQSALQLASARSSEATSSDTTAAALTVVENATRARDAAAEAYLGAVLGSGPTVAMGELVFVPSLPARVRSTIGALGPVGSTGNGAGAVGNGGSALVELQAGQLVVEATVRVGDETMVRVGMPVELLDETTNTTYAGRVASIADEVTVDESGGAGRAAVIVPLETLPDSLTGTNLRVTFTAASSDGAVLVVPVAAVSATANGTTRVSVIAAGSDTPVDVAVTAGISADGFVMVEPIELGSLSEGDLVVVGR